MQSDVDRPPDAAFQAGIEEARWVVKAGPARKVIVVDQMWGVDMLTADLPPSRARRPEKAARRAPRCPKKARKG